MPRGGISEEKDNFAPGLDEPAGYPKKFRRWPKGPRNYGGVQNIEGEILDGSLDDPHIRKRKNPEHVQQKTTSLSVRFDENETHLRIGYRQNQPRKSGSSPEVKAWSVCYETNSRQGI